jgi:hypothetical protein
MATGSSALISLGLLRERLPGERRVALTPADVKRLSAKAIVTVETGAGLEAGFPDAAASGPVGSLVGQLAKLAGARAVGIAGGLEKCAFVKEEFLFDAAVDHHAADFPAQLAAACPDGIDVYFENVGGAVWQAVLPLLNTHARIPVSGLIAQYNGVGPGDGTDRLPATMREILSKSLTLRGFINFEFGGQYYDEFLRDVGAGIADGRIRYREDIVDGLDKAPEAFIGMLDGRNFGKLIVRVGAD